MIVVSSTQLPVVDGDLGKTVSAFVSVLRDHCTFDGETLCLFSLITDRPKLLGLIARALPAEAGEFMAFVPPIEK